MLFMNSLTLRIILLASILMLLTGCNQAPTSAPVAPVQHLVSAAPQPKPEPLPVGFVPDVQGFVPDKLTDPSIRFTNQSSHLVDPSTGYVELPIIMPNYTLAPQPVTVSIRQDAPQPEPLEMTPAPKLYGEPKPSCTDQTVWAQIPGENPVLVTVGCE